MEVALIILEAVLTTLVVIQAEVPSTLVVIPEVALSIKVEIQEVVRSILVEIRVAAPLILEVRKTFVKIYFNPSQCGLFSPYRLLYHV